MDFISRTSKLIILVYLIVVVTQVQKGSTFLVLGYSNNKIFVVCIVLHQRLKRWKILSIVA